MCCTSSCKLFHTARGYHHYYQSKYSALHYKAPATSRTFLNYTSHAESCRLQKVRTRVWTVYRALFVSGLEHQGVSLKVFEGIRLPMKSLYSAPSDALALLSVLTLYTRLCVCRLSLFSFAPLKSGFLDSLSFPALVIRSNAPPLSPSCTSHFTQRWMGGGGVIVSPSDKLGVGWWGKK